GIGECTAEGQVKYYNRHMADLVGIADGESFGDAWARAVHPDDLTMLRDGWARMVASGGEWQQDYRLQTLDRGTRWVRSLLTPAHVDAGGQPSTFMGIVED